MLSQREDGRRIVAGCTPVLPSGAPIPRDNFSLLLMEFEFIRIATDLNLHLVSTVKPQSERQEREIMNKTRVWMICFNLDRSTATQFGKPSTIKEDL